MYTKTMTFDFEDRAHTFVRKMNSPKRRNDVTLPEIAEVGPVVKSGDKWAVDANQLRQISNTYAPPGN